MNIAKLFMDAAASFQAAKVQGANHDLHNLAEGLVQMSEGLRQLAEQVDRIQARLDQDS